ncbi:MAG: peptidylprolyl isomerase, partial [Flammeovirgaceae bacterium]
VVGFVAVAILAFILNDLFGNGPRSVFQKDDSVGEIAGNSISREEYQTMVQERENNYIMNFARQAGEREKPLLQSQAWELLTVKHAIRPQFEKTGIQVSTDEVWDMVQGKNVDENLKQSFTDSTGKFDRKRVVEYLNNFNTPEPVGNPQMRAQWQEMRYRWASFQDELKLGRERIKYENLLIKTNYVTNAEAERDYHLQNDVAEAEYLYVPFYAISDTLVTPTDSQLRDYYNKNREKYKTAESRSMVYVTFPVVASSSDSAKVLADAQKFAADFKTSEDDSTFAVSNTEGKEAFNKYNVSTLPSSIKSADLVAGNVVGPFLDNGAYKVIKVTKIGNDTTYYAKASHILIKWENETDAAKKTAKEKARKILAEIKGGASFAAKAREFGTDGTASRGGDLGWFPSGQMVKPCQNAVFDAKKTGLLGDVVETQFGYHIIEVTAVKDNTTYSVASIELQITPSDETQNTAFLKAQNFGAQLASVDEFKAKAKKENLFVQEANDLTASDRRIGNLGEARQMVTWLYRDGKTDKVSDVFDQDDNYVVAMMTAKMDEGYKPFEKVKEEITPLVKGQLKGEKIIEKLNAQKGTLQEIAQGFGRDASVNSASDIKLNSNSLTSVGIEPKAIGVAFSLENGKRSRSFAGENGVLIIETKNKTIAPEVGDYSLFKTQLLQNLNGKSSFGISQAIKEAAKIEDKRYLFF